MCLKTELFPRISDNYSVKICRINFFWWVTWIVDYVCYLHYGSHLNTRQVKPDSYNSLMFPLFRSALFKTHFNVSIEFNKKCLQFKWPILNGSHVKYRALDFVTEDNFKWFLQSCIFKIHYELTSINLYILAHVT